VTDTQKTYAIVGAAVVIGLVVWIALVLVPAWGSYSRLWDRFLATLLSLYVLAAFVLVGAGVGGVILWYSDRL
jgi:O-antigen ligase